MVILSGIGSDEEIKNLKEIEVHLNEIDDNQLEFYKLVANKQTKGVSWQHESDVLRFAYAIANYNKFGEKRIEKTIYLANRLGLLTTLVKHDKEDVVFEKEDTTYYKSDGIKVCHMRDDVVQPILNMKYRNPKHRFGNEEFE